MSNSTLRVLVVDDDPVASQVLAEVLRAANHEVETRANALGTTAVVMRGDFNVLVLDLKMPGLCGDEVAQLIVECFEDSGSQPEVIFYSGAEREELAAVSAQLGALGWIEKSLGPLAMADRFRQLTSKFQGELRRRDATDPQPTR